MTDRAYTETKITSDINCSSSADHFVRVKLLKRGAWTSYDYWIEGDSLIGKRGWGIECPAYVRRMIRAALLAELKAGARVFEYDRDGNERDTELRYHAPDWIERRIATLEADLK